MKKVEFGQSGRAGILPIFILSRLEIKPYSGYDIISEISKLTKGSWKPGSGSIYPILKGMKDRGLIAISHTGERGLIKYKITEKGLNYLKEAKLAYDKFSIERWHTVRGIIMELLEPKSLAQMLNETLEMQIDSWEKVIKSDLGKEEKIFLMNENMLLLKRNMEWIDRKIKSLK